MIESVSGVILCGGQSRRFGTNKAWAPYQGSTLIETLISTVSPQLAHLCLSVRSESTEYEQLDLPHVYDQPNHQGPLAGMLSAMDWATINDSKWLATFPVDSPNIPNQVVSLWMKKAEQTQADVVILQGGNQKQWALGLWSLALRDVIEVKLNAGHYAIQDTLNALNVAYLECPNAIENINYPKDLTES